MLAVRGVSAANQNDWRDARQDFLEAYSLDANSAFSLNNLGYVAEKDGDLETADFFYDKARKAGDATARVGLTTQPSAEGMNLSTVAADSDQKVDSALGRYSEARHRQTGPIELTPRYGGPVGPSGGAANQPSSPSAPAPSPSTSPQPPR
jgi:tetratricopeptide (TPR) repeat protein